MARGAGPGRKHPVANTGGQVGDRGLAALENGRELPGDGKLQGHTGLRFLHAKREGFHVDPFPAEREDLVAPHAGVEPEPQGIPDCLVIDFRFDPLLPAGGGPRRELKSCGAPSGGICRRLRARDRLGCASHRGRHKAGGRPPAWRGGHGGAADIVDAGANHGHELHQSLQMGRLQGRPESAHRPLSARPLPARLRPRGSRRIGRVHDPRLLFGAEI